jgi:hypothetical protein
MSNDDYIVKSNVAIYGSFISTASEGLQKRGTAGCVGRPSNYTRVDKEVRTRDELSDRRGFVRRSESSPKNLLHRLSLCELIDQFVQIAYLSHQRIVDFFHSNTAHDAFDPRTILMNGRGLSEKSLKVVSLFDLPLKSGSIIARQPTNDLVNFISCAILSFRLLNIQRIDLRK